MTIHLARDVSAEAEVQIRRLVDRECWQNPNWSGHVFRIERSDFTSIDGRDSNAARAVVLFHQIQGIISGAEVEG